MSDKQQHGGKRPGAGRPKGASPQNRSGEPSLAEARRRKESALARLRELEFAKQAGALVAVEDLLPALHAWAGRGRQAIEAAESRIIDGIEAEFGIALEWRHVREHLRDAMRAIADFPKSAAHRTGGEDDPQ